MEGRNSAEEGKWGEGWLKKRQLVREGEFKLVKNWPRIRGVKGLKKKNERPGKRWQTTENVRKERDEEINHRRRAKNLTNALRKTTLKKKLRLEYFGPFKKGLEGKKIY